MTKKQPDKPIDIMLDVDQVQPEHMSHVWGVLTRVAEGLALDGYEVGVRQFRWGDDGDDLEEDVVPVGPTLEEDDQR